MHKTIKYTPKTVDNLWVLIRDFRIQQKEQSMTLSELWDKITSLEISITFTRAGSGLIVEIDYEKNDFEEISLNVLNLFKAYSKDKMALSDFQYKMKISTRTEKDLVIDFCEKNEYKLNMDTTEQGSNQYFNIGKSEVYSGTRRFYNLSSDEYLYARSDSYKKVDVLYFFDIIFVMDYLGLEY